MTTERQMLDALHVRYSKEFGNGPRFVCAEHVRSDAGFDARRTIDFVAQDLWPSDGTAIHGHEVKTSRSDWLRELKDPSKAAAFTPFCSYWWIVVADRAIVKPGELLPGWGLMALTDRGVLRVVTSARRSTAYSLPPGMVASLVRSAAKTAARRALEGVIL